MKKYEIPIEQYNPDNEYPEGAVIVWEDEDMGDLSRFEIPHYLKDEPKG